MYHSSHDTLLALPDRVTVMPAHGAGSSCGKNPVDPTHLHHWRTTPHQPVGAADERRRLRRSVTHGQPAAPAYFSVDAAMNKRVHPLLDQHRKISASAPAQIRKALDDGVRVVDARSVGDFAAGRLWA
jgi:hydroxyacylglutathione hydrolase